MPSGTGSPAGARQALASGRHNAPMVEYGGAVGGAGGGGGVSAGAGGVAPHIGNVADNVGNAMNGLLHGAAQATAGIPPLVLVAAVVLLVFAVVFLRRAI